MANKFCSIGPRPFPDRRRKNRYRKDEPIYDTPSMPSLNQIPDKLSKENDHYYSIPTEEPVSKPVPLIGEIIWQYNLVLSFSVILFK